MPSLMNFLIMAASATVASLGFTSHCNLAIMLLLVFLFLYKNNSLINLMLLLELMILSIMFFILLESYSMHINYWNIFSILVLSAVEASVGLSLIVSLTRIWGSAMKISLFK